MVLSLGSNLYSKVSPEVKVYFQCPSLSYSTYLLMVRNLWYLLSVLRISCCSTVVDLSSI